MKKVSAVVIIAGLALIFGLAALDSSASSSASPSKTKGEACQSKLSAKARKEIEDRHAAYTGLSPDEKNLANGTRASERADYYKLSLPAQAIVRAENQDKKPKASDKDAAKEAAAYQALQKEKISKLPGKVQMAIAPLSAATKKELMTKCGGGAKSRSNKQP